MMINHCLNTFLLCLFSSGLAIAQKPFDAKIIREFQNAKNDSVFLNQYSDLRYQIETLDFTYNDTSGNKLTTDLFLGEIGQVYGPYYTDTSVFHVKIVAIDFAYKARVGNIWLDIKRGRETALELANQILKEIEAGKAYNQCCKLYSDDKNENVDCDLGWIYNNVMLEPFATEITKHRKGDIYLIETHFGFHVVKSLAEPFKERQTVRYLILSRIN